MRSVLFLKINNNVGIFCYFEKFYLVEKQNKEKFVNKISRFVVSEFVKTCNELVIDLGIQAFSQMLAYFSADGLTYHPQYVKVVNKEPLVSYKSQNITLSLAKRIGRFVKLEVYFDNKWLLISEVNFKSQSTGKDMDFIDAVAAAGTNSNASNHIKTENQKNSEQDRNDPAQVLSDTPELHSGGSSENGATLNTNAKSNLTAKETNQVSKLHTRYRLFCPFCTQFFLLFSCNSLLSPKFTKKSYRKSMAIRKRNCLLLKCICS